MAAEYDLLPFDRDFDVGDDDEDNLYEAIEVLLADEDDESHNSESKFGGMIIPTTDKGNKTTKKRATSTRQPKKRKLNPDAATIATCTEAALKDLDIDPESEDAKKMRRQIRNRLSAQFHRDRKNMYIKTLEDKVAEKEKEIENLKAEVSKLKEENRLLRHANDHGVTDSDSSSTTSPAHEPTNMITIPTYVKREFNHKSSYIISPSGPYPSIMGAPLIKSLSVLSVICLLCLTGLAPNGVLIGDGSKVITKQSVIESGIMDELLSYREGSRRLLAMEDLENPVELNQHLTAKLVLPVNTSMGSTFEESSSIEQHQPKFHLRRAVENTNMSFNSSIALPSLGESGLSFASKSIFVSKDLIHFDSSHSHNYKHSWFADHKADSLSYSHIVMNKGVALFDPSLQLSDSPLALQTHTAHGFPIIQTSPQNNNQDPSMHNHILPFGHSGLLAAPHSLSETAVPMEMDEEDSMSDRDSKGLVTKNWPMISNPSSPLSTSAIQRHHKVDIHPSFGNVAGSAGCELEKQALLNQLLAKSNLVTVTLPASSVRMGKSLSESKDGTVESIMQLFNLTALNGEDGRGSHLSGSPTADASLEINCILLGAKMVVNTSSK